MIRILKGEEEPRRWLHGEHEAGIHSNQFIVTAEDKFIWYSQTGREQYFNLKEDPHELHDLIGEEAYKERIRWLRARLIESLEGREEGYTDGQKLITGRRPMNVLSFLRNRCDET